jgi:hypothetical protein
VIFVFNFNVDCITVTVHFFGFKEKRGVGYPEWLIDENVELMYQVFAHNVCKLAQSENCVSDICFDSSLCALCPMCCFMASELFSHILTYGCCVLVNKTFYHIPGTH